MSLDEVDENAPVLLWAGVLDVRGLRWHALAMSTEQHPAQFGHEDDHDTIRLALNEPRDNARITLTGAGSGARWRRA